MPEINPLTNNQIFLKKIAENTGSDYDIGDVSEINPLTIEQILLKEIAANTAGQSGDITELEGKVADNTEAIRTLSDTMAANGIYNLLPHPYEDSTKTIGTITYTVNNDWSITIEGDAQNDNTEFALFSGIVSDIFPKVGRYKIGFGKSTFPAGLAFRITINGTTTQGGSYPYELDVTSEMLSQTLVMTIRLWGSFGISPAFTVYPVVYPDGTMTNKELTDMMTRRYYDATRDTTKTTNGTIKCVVRGGWAYVMFQALAFANAGDSQKGLVSGLPVCRANSLTFSLLGDSVFNTAAVNNGGDMFWIDEDETTLNGNLSSATYNKNHWGTVVYPTD